MSGCSSTVSAVGVCSNSLNRGKRGCVRASGKSSSTVSAAEVGSNTLNRGKRGGARASGKSSSTVRAADMNSYSTIWSENHRGLLE